MSDQPWSYAGRRVIVTGAASGMGAATARLVGARGAEVIALDLREPADGVGRHVRVDLADAGSIERAVEDVGAPVHAVFACAGLPQTFPAVDVVSVNFGGTRELVERVVPLMPPGGAVAIVSSLASIGWQQALPVLRGLLDTPDVGAARAWAAGHPEEIGDGYSFSKMALVAYALERAPALAATGVRVNCLSPGPTDTPMMPKFEEALGKGWMERFPRPMGRNATAEEQAEVLAFLNSAAASCVTGANVFSDGGISAAFATGQVSKPERPGRGAR